MLVTCPHCRQAVSFPDASGGVTVHCPACAAVLQPSGHADTDQPEAPTLPPPRADAAATAGFCPASELPAGQPRRAGRYLVEELIAEGGMGAVLRIRDPDLGRALAVKVMRPGAAARPGALERFLEEARLTGQLQHPGVPPVHELGRLDDGLPFFAMKLIKGRTLAALLRERPDPGRDLPRFVGVFRQVCQAVAYAHSRGVIHRDLKPLNVMVGAFGEVQVMDWGLAKALPRLAEEGPAPAAPADTAYAVRPDPAHTLTQTGDVMGTPGYMAPEQARGEAVDERCDVFGLGAILCEVLTGRPPFATGGGLDRRLQAMDGNITEAFARLAGCGADAELVGLARRCLAVRKEDRPRHAGQVAEAVERYEALVQERLRRAEVERAAASARAQAERRRRRATLGLAGAVLLLVAGAAGAALWYQQDRAERGADEARLEEGKRQRQRVRAQGIDEALGQARQARAALQARLARPGGVVVLLNRPADWQQHIEAARAALRRAADLEAGAEVPVAADLQHNRQQLEALLRQDEDDRRLALRLEKVRADRSNLVEGRFNLGVAERDYPRALADAGLALSPGKEGQAADLVRRSAIKEQLLVALDDWAFVAWMRGKKDLQRRLLRVARQADPDPWKDQVRDPARWDSRRALKDLAARALADKTALARTSPQMLGLLGALLREGDAAENWLRQAQALHPADFWLNYYLGLALYKAKPPQAEGFFRAALAVRSESPEVWNVLGVVLREQKDLRGAVAAYQKALALDPRYGYAWNNLGCILCDDDKDARGAAAAFRKALALDPKNARAWFNLGNALLAQKEARPAAGAYRQAVALDPRNAVTWTSFGKALLEQKEPREAAEACRQAIAFAPKHAPAWHTLGLALHRQKDVRGAVDAFRKAVTLDPPYVRAWDDLANVLLFGQRDAPGAVNAYRKVVALDPTALAWNNLGFALYLQFRVDGRQGLPEAAAAFRKALALDRQLDKSRLGLGLVLQEEGDFAAAAASLRRALELLPPGHSLVSMAQEHLRECRHLLALEERLPVVLRGEKAAAAEQLELADLCRRYRKRYRDAVRLYGATFAGRPRLAEDVKKGKRYDAACAAALAAAGAGRDGENQNDGDKVAPRKQALAWLRADLQAWNDLLQTDRQAAAVVKQKMEHWRRNADLAGVRDEQELARLPAEERRAWRELWADVGLLLDQARGPRPGAPPGKAVRPAPGEQP
jgi:Tfp pilus assembly protein PilF